VKPSVFLGSFYVLPNVFQVVTRLSECMLERYLATIITKMYFLSENHAALTSFSPCEQTLS